MFIKGKIVKIDGEPRFLGIVVVDDRAKTFVKLKPVLSFESESTGENYIILCDNDLRAVGFKYCKEDEVYYLELIESKADRDRLERVLDEAINEILEEKMKKEMNKMN